MRLRDKLSGASWVFHFSPDDPDLYEKLLDVGTPAVQESIGYLIASLEYLVLLEQAGSLYVVRCIHQGGEHTGPARNVAFSFRGENLPKILATAAVQAAMIQGRTAWYGTASTERYQVVG